MIRKSRIEKQVSEGILEVRINYDVVDMGNGTERWQKRNGNEEYFLNGKRIPQDEGQARWNNTYC